ncbi:MAG: ABC transporter ATP-binding protein, partial [Alphaproteobacteria bacterium]|nr:ABC transporter ATP-binding protein [Alphaproteobacteria bacterium]
MRRAPGEVAVSARHVSAAYGRTVVLDDLDLEVRHGELVAVMGRNGSGKSTLSRVIAGLVAPRTGQVRINGHDPARDRRAALREVGILFQNPDHQIIFPTVIEEIAFGLTQMGQPRTDAAEAARAILARFGVAHWQDAQVATLSQGQKHLVCLMAVVAMAPGLLILDEPFAGLD